MNKITSWEVHRGDDYAAVQSKDGATIFQVNGVYGDEAGDEIIRDLTLAAAAPDMLAALMAAEETLAQVCEGQHDDNVCCHHLRAVRAAIAKARRRP